MRKTTPMIVLAAGLLSSAALSGQNLNPTIEVTNTYQRKAADVGKPQQKMNIPDSLLRFDLDFDYEVFDRPYEGAYSFKPYMLDMRPEKDAWRGRKFFLKAGAGYSLRPEAEVVWSPELSGRFQMSLHASHSSYFGSYNSIAPKRTDPDKPLALQRDGGKTYKGRDSFTEAGFDGRVGWDKAVLTFDAAYKRLDVKDTVLRQAWESADFGFRVRTTNTSGKYFLYDVGFRGSLGFGSLDYALPFIDLPNGYYGGSALLPSGRSYLNETGFRLKGEVGPVFNDHHKLLVGFETVNYKYSQFLSSSASRLMVNPKYKFEKNRWDITLGFKLEDRLSGQVDSLRKNTYPVSHPSTGVFLYPDVEVSFQVAEAVSLWAGLTGGGDIDTYSSSLMADHHFNPARSMELRCPLLDFTGAAYNLSLGLRGRVASRLQFDLKGGVAYFENAPFQTVWDATPWSASSMPEQNPAASGLYPAVYYYDPFLAYADLALAWQSKSLTVDAAFHYKHALFPDYDPELGAAFDYPFEPSALSADVRALYNIGPRIRVGLDVQAATRRDQAKAGNRGYSIPGYVDLGIVGSWQVSRKFGLWLESGNLLCMSIQRVPLVSERGPWGTVGVTLSL